MPIACDDVNARFGFDLYRGDEEEAQSEVCFTTEAEMRQHVDTLGRAGNFSEIHLYRARSDGEWEDDAFVIITPEDYEEA